MMSEPSAAQARAPQSAPRQAIIYVPGKSPKPSPAVHSELLWKSLRRGVARAQGAAGTLLDNCRFRLAAWNFLYYQRHDSLSADVPWIERLIEGDGPTEADIREARHWSKWATRGLYDLGDRFHWLIPWLPDPRVKSMLRDTMRYFENRDGIADRIRNLVATEIEGAAAESRSLCVIGHSMGSVIAYEALWKLTHEERRPPTVGLFLTLGSPLGMRYVQKHLLGLRDDSRRFPAGIRRWVNVSATGDLVSVDQQVADDFSPMVDKGLTRAIEDVHEDVYTAFRNSDGLNPHRSYGYLVHPQVGEVLRRWLAGSS